MDAIILLFVTLLFALDSTAASTDYVGRTKCASCHPAQSQLWSGSHHDLAMQPATADTVLGDFADASVTHFGVTSSFFKENGKFMVRTEGSAGKLEDFEIKYTFGVHPLQQYLIEFPGGRMQVLSLAWDTRAQEQGGQRWFHLYPDEKIAHDDELHWTRLNQNWKGMYFADGQMDDEVYVYGSFVQSKMYQAGVTCSDCHDPHSLDLKLPGNGVCLQCHQASKYNDTGHHFHQPDSQGASCAECPLLPAI